MVAGRGDDDGQLGRRPLGPAPDPGLRPLAELREGVWMRPANLAVQLPDWLFQLWRTSRRSRRRGGRAYAPRARRGLDPRDHCSIDPNRRPLTTIRSAFMAVDNRWAMRDGRPAVQAGHRGPPRSWSPTAGRGWRWPRRGPGPGDGPGRPGPGRSAGALPTTATDPVRGRSCRPHGGVGSMSSVSPTVPHRLPPPRRWRPGGRRRCCPEWSRRRGTALGAPPRADAQRLRW
jgi:hypothetical protein